ncbi:MAG: hypothetical protein LCH39_06525 [Proteobacteria bacterium]|nr:hypothetical protein [Pseudomonadota bacterium]
MKTPPDNEPGGVFSSHLARAAKHLAADDGPQDEAERWGKRIGRALSALALLALAWYFGHQLKWW